MPWPHLLLRRPCAEGSRQHSAAILPTSTQGNRARRGRRTLDEAGTVPVMDLSYPPEAEEFRTEIAGWLRDNLPEGWDSPDFSMTPEERKDFNEEWTAKLFAGGWICASWPAEYGGKGLSLLQQVVLNEEFARAGAPLRADFFGDTLVGPTILQWGTEEQKQFFLPKIAAPPVPPTFVTMKYDPATDY